MRRAHGRSFLRTMPSAGHCPHPHMERIPQHGRLLGLALLAVLSACGDQPATNTDAAEPDLVIGDDTPTAATSLYQMPTPNELFGLVREMAGEGQKRMMNPASNVERYATLASRAVNFGVYSTDLIYASSFDLNVEVVRYYLTVKKLGDELGLTAAFSEKDFSRLESNLAHGDSLEIISNDAYYKAYEKLQDENMGATLALVLAGGWVESMHLVVRQVDKYTANDPLIARIADQKVTLEHLVDMLEPHAQDKDVAPVRDELIELRALYDALPVTRKPHEGKSASGRMVLGDDVHVDMSEANYTAISQAVEALRERLTRTDDQPAGATKA